MFVQMFTLYTYLFGHKVIIQADHQAFLFSYMHGIRFTYTYAIRAYNNFATKSYSVLNACKNISLKCNNYLCIVTGECIVKC